MIVRRVVAPLILVRSTEDAQGLTIRRLIFGQGYENLLGTGGRAHLCERQRHSLLEPVVLWIRFADGRARGIVGH